MSGIEYNRSSDQYKIIIMDILNRIIPNAETYLPFGVRFIDKLKFFEKEKGKWYIKSLDCDGREKLVFNEESGKKAPEEVVLSDHRQI